MRRDHEQHRNASDERVRLRRITAHEEKVREIERARERRRIMASLVCPESVEDPTGFGQGCVI
jgi:hypothetical protein